MDPLPEETAPPLSWWQLGWRIALSVAIGVVAWFSIASGTPEEPHWLAVWAGVADPLLGVVSTVLVARSRRRHPVRVGLVTSAMSVVSLTTAGPATWALCSVATRRAVRGVVLVSGAYLLAALANEGFYRPLEGEAGAWWSGFILIALLTGLVVAVGRGVGARRALVVSLRERAETAEREQAARLDQARITERTRIAREMHDVLAHRISLVAMHAGALSYRVDLDDEQRATALRAVEDNARQALADLRDVLGVLREPVPAAGPPLDGAPHESVPGPGSGAEPPQPRLADLEALLEQTRSGDTPVTLRMSVADDLPERLQRTVYRVVQESLTNAVKHAPGGAVTVEITGVPDQEVTVRVVNGPARRATLGLPSARLGLVGLRERVELVGGRLEDGPAPTGGYIVDARLPWSG